MTWCEKMNQTTRRSILVVLGICSILPSAGVLAAPPVVAWRGDGTGKYPDATPPLAWSRTSTAVKSLRYGAELATNADAGTAMADGVIRDWLVVGPLPLTQTKGQEPSAIPDEAALAPTAGQAAGAKQWRKVSLDSAYLDFTRLVGKPEDEDVAAFAFTHVFSPTGGKFRVNLTTVGHARLWINGKPPSAMGSRLTIELAKGWNRLLLRVSPGEKDWYVVPVLQGQGRCEYQQSGIAWRVALPGAAPSFYGGGMGGRRAVIVGDRMYLLSEPHDLICIGKSSGKVLWIRRASYFEAASDDEQKLPAYAEAQSLAVKIDAINAAVVAGAASPAQIEEKGKLEASLRKQMKQIDSAKYASQPIPDVGFSGFTPATDGRFIFAWFGDGVSACFTLDGERRWIRVDQRPAVEHGFSSSPTLVGGKFVVFMRDLLAFDCGDGKPAWQTPIVAAEGLNPGNFIHGSLIAATIGDTAVVLLGNGTIVRASDGKTLWQADGDNQAVPSPVVDGRFIFHVTHGNADLTVREISNHLTEPLDLPTRTMHIDLSSFPTHYLPWHLSSPLIHDGLAYMVNNAGVLTVIDVAAGKTIYQKLLDLDVFQDHNEGAARRRGQPDPRRQPYLHPWQ